MQMELFAIFTKTSIALRKGNRRMRFIRQCQLHILLCAFYMFMYIRAKGIRSEMFITCRSIRGVQLFRSLVWQENFASEKQNTFLSHRNCIYYPRCILWYLHFIDLQTMHNLLAILCIRVSCIWIQTKLEVMTAHGRLYIVICFSYFYNCILTTDTKQLLQSY